MFCASYNGTHPDKIIENDASQTEGYRIRWENGSFVNPVNGLIKDEYNSIYIKSDTSKANGMWLASPAMSHTYSDYDNLAGAYYNGEVKYTPFNYGYLGLRPIVCLKQGVQLKKLDDGSLQIVK